jgi:acetyl esterase
MLYSSLFVLLLAIISYNFYNSINITSFLIAKGTLFISDIFTPLDRNWHSEGIQVTRSRIEQDYIQYDNNTIDIYNIPLSENDHRHKQEAYLKYEKVLYRIYVPKNSSNLDVLIWFHGGGFVIGNVRTEDQLCHDIALQSKKIVVNVNYGLAPENKFPIAHNDSIEAFKWVHKNIHEYNGNKDNIFLGGESAGGNLVISMFPYIKVPIKGIISIYPPLQVLGFTNSNWKYANYNGFLKFDHILKAFTVYLNNIIKESTNTIISPLLLSNNTLKTFPKVLLIIAEYDVLRDDGIMFYNKLNKLGVDVKLFLYNDIHGFFNRFGNGKKALNEVYKFLN